MVAAVLILVVLVGVAAGLNPSREQFAWFLRLRRPAWLVFEGLIPAIWLVIYVCFMDPRCWPGGLVGAGG
jgi:tryptophan-rich sensory protein